jgi:hypothetical protein
MKIKTLCLIDQLVDKFCFEPFSEFMKIMFTDNQRKCRVAAKTKKKNACLP